MKLVRNLFATAALITATVFAGAASAQVTTFNTQSGFAAGTTGDTQFGFDFDAQPVEGLTYTNGPVTFSSQQLTSFNDAYGMPYISDDNYSGESSNTFTITSTSSALGLFLGSYFGDSTYSYAVNGIAGSIAVPAADGTTFLGFASASGPISVTFNVSGTAGENSELDVPQFIAGSAIAAAAPEPATWAMMILGFGVVGFAMRNAKRHSDDKFDAKIKKITYGAIA